MAAQSSKSDKTIGKSTQTFVWVDSWQQQCCGDDFRVGSHVKWQVRRTEPSADWVATLLGKEWGDKVCFAEEHHDNSADAELNGMVQSIQAVTCDRQLEKQSPRLGSQKVWVPIPGSGQLRKVETAGLTEETYDPSHTFDGWIVGVHVEQLT
ncbi:DUF6578 domain-containing protein [Blastococcus sp. TF02-9]|uniref:DUF6578 domain-containing protein n=1 Tax=Blastococcus sp. TF02-09 TaxID=2250576 RepID=UPI0011BE3DC8|nr:DUF6578 domain-containing protein [Blastococcus sp. TF02-9]